MKVVKFGGSSLASAIQLEKVFKIVQEDEERKYVIVSAPGKRDAADTKVTDALITTSNTSMEKIRLKAKNGSSTDTAPSPKN